MHVRLDSDDEDERPSSSAAASTSQYVAAACMSETRVDYNFNDPCYVFRAAKPFNVSAVSVSLSSNSIKTYNFDNGQLVFVGELKGHANTITDIAYPLQHCPYALFSSSRDGSVVAWDMREGKEVERHAQQQRHELFSFAASDTILVAGGQGSLFFWDRRVQKLLAVFEDTHMDDITQVKLHPGSGRVISGSQSGLITVHDVSSAFDEDAGFLAALNVNTSVEEVGMYGAAGERLWVRTGTETLHLWDWALSTQEEVEGGDGCFLELPEARAALTEAASSSPAAASFQQVDYLVGCHYDAPSGQLVTLAGTNEGSLGLFPVHQHLAGQEGVPAGRLVGPPAFALTGKHNSVVRSAVLFEAAGNPMAVTGGEDSVVALWNLKPGGVGGGGSRPTGSRTSSQDSGPARREHSSVARRNPY